MKILFYISTIIFIITMFYGCNDNTTRNMKVEKTFVPDKTYLSHTISNQEEEGSFSFPKTNEGYELAGIELKNPLPATRNNINRGRQIFEGHCAHCHGLTGNADATMILKGKYPPPPPFRIRLLTINEGKMFHSIRLGKNFMPSHKEELNVEESWQVITYITKTFKAKK